GGRRGWVGGGGGRVVGGSRGRGGPGPPPDRVHAGDLAVHAELRRRREDLRRAWGEHAARVDTRQRRLRPPAASPPALTLGLVSLDSGLARLGEPQRGRATGRGRPWPARTPAG